MIDRKFSFAWANEVGDTEVLANLIKELIDYRLATYKVRRSHQPVATHYEFIPISKQRNRLPYFPNLTLAYDHFKTGRLDGLVYHSLPSAYGDLNPDLHFISRASDNSMKGDGNVINEGDFLLLERFTSNDLGTALDSVVAVEYGGVKTSELRINLRVINRNSSGETLLHALNLNYPDLPVTGNVCAFGKLITVIDRLDLAVGESFIREEIPALFSEKFSPGNWNSGHIVFNDKKTHVLLVTLNKQGRSDEHRYHDYWIDKNTFHWQSQNNTAPSSKKGQEIIEHVKRGIAIHLFIRETKLNDGKGAPFTYKGKVTYISHTGSSPMSVIYRV